MYISNIWNVSGTPAEVCNSFVLLRAVSSQLVGNTKKKQLRKCFKYKIFIMPHTHFKLYSCPQLFNLTISYRTSNFSNTSETIVVGAYTQPTECRGERSKKRKQIGNASSFRRCFLLLCSLQIFTLKLNIKCLHEDTFA